MVLQMVRGACGPQDDRLLKVVGEELSGDSLAMVGVVVCGPEDMGRRRLCSWVAQVSRRRSL